MNEKEPSSAFISALITEHYVLQSGLGKDLVVREELRPVDFCQLSDDFRHNPRF